MRVTGQMSVFFNLQNKFFVTIQPHGQMFY